MPQLFKDLGTLLSQTFDRALNDAKEEIVEAVEKLLPSNVKAAVEDGARAGWQGFKKNIPFGEFIP